LQQQDEQLNAPLHPTIDVAFLEEEEHFHRDAEAVLDDTFDDME
jgi:hypothetical protein